MGALTSRQNGGVEEIDFATNHAYKYPPRSGNYFGSHFIMGGERFDTPQPESYLFGENSDLNFLGSRPTPFPYSPPQTYEPTKTLKSLVNIRKESLKFVRVIPDASKLKPLGKKDDVCIDLEGGRSTLFNVEFVFDCDVRCAITIHYFCTEEITATGATYNSQGKWRHSDTFYYKKGANQLFSQPSHVFDPSKFSDDDLLYNPEKEVIPIAIQCVAEEGDEPRQSHTTMAIVEKHSDGTYVIKALKQKLFVDGLCYLLQEIYGIENKNNEKSSSDEETEDNGSECVICMCDVRDTLILPCRHLCLCNSCADSLRYQANNCPICRAPFRALLQIKALQKTTCVQALVNQPDASGDSVPVGYEAVSLVEALNGPRINQRPAAVVLDLNDSIDGDSVPSSRKESDKKNTAGTPEFCMSVLLSRDEEAKETPKSPLLAKNSVQAHTKGGKSFNVRETSLSDETEKEENLDEDSEAEKLSPLLDKSPGAIKGEALEMAEVVESIDDTDTEQEESIAKPAGRTKWPKGGSPDSAQGEQNGREPSDSIRSGGPGGGSLPDTPLSHVSTRSSADSYGSGSSTKHLLSTPPNAPQNSYA